jgi:hypothetical protein
MFATGTQDLRHVKAPTSYQLPKSHHVSPWDGCWLVESFNELYLRLQVHSNAERLAVFIVHSKSRLRRKGGFRLTAEMGRDRLQL